MIQIGTYNDIPLLVPREDHDAAIGRIVYFRRFGAVAVYCGYGTHPKAGFINRPIHPDSPRVAT